MKLKVLSHQAMEAQYILETINKYSIDDDGKTISCPNCDSDKIELFSTIKDAKSLFWFIFGVLFSSLPFYTKHKFKCEDCKTEFDLK